MIPIHSEATMTATQILADLADGGGEQYIPAHVIYEDQPPPEEVMYENQILQEVNIDLLVHGVEKPAPSSNPSAYFAENLHV